MKKLLFTSMILTLVLIMCLPITVFAGGGQLNLTISSEGMVTWTKPKNATHFELQIWDGVSDKGGSLKKKDSNYTSESFDFKSYLDSLNCESGYYEIVVHSRGNDNGVLKSDWDTYYYTTSLPKLDAPINLKWDGKIAKWSAVDNATKYKVTIYDSDGLIEYVCQSSEPEFDFSPSKYQLKDGKYFTVVAEADNYRNSNVSNESLKYVAPTETTTTTVEPTTTSHKVTVLLYETEMDDYNYGGKYTIKYGNTNDTSDSSNSYTIEDGTSVTLTAAPDSGYKFLRWEISGGSKQTNATCTFKVSADVNYMAVFEKVDTATEQPTQTEQPTKTEEPVKTEEPAKTEEPTQTEQPKEKTWTKASEWAEEELDKANKMEIIPNKLKYADLTANITRAEFAHVAVKLYEKLTGNKAIAVPNNPFIDTADEEVLKAYNLEITKGTSEVTFNPDDLITREQMATMMTRALTKAGIDTKVDLEKVNKFADDGEMHDWGKESIYYMSSIEIIKGVGNNTFNVLGNATREQALLISERSAEKFAK